jgi:HIV Tat-specific factor 1
VDPDTGVQLYKDANDGMTYEWDKEKNAWFPRIDDSFMAQYQMSYGFTPDGNQLLLHFRSEYFFKINICFAGKAEPTLPSAPSQPNSDALAEEEAKKLKKAEESKKRAQWFEEDEVYIKFMLFKLSNKSVS